MVIEFNAPPETPLNDPPTEFVPPTDQSSQVAHQPPQVINEDSPTINVGSGGDANEDDDLVQIDNPVVVLSSEDCPPGSPN